MAAADSKHGGPRVLTVDAFTEVPFCGNPCAVVLIEEAGRINDGTMQLVAAEMNLSETAFVIPRPLGDGGGFGSVSASDHFDLRWFTPTCEVPLCGHGTMAAAKAVVAAGNAHGTLTFHTLSGPLAVRCDPGGTIAMDLPNNAPTKDDPAIDPSVIELAACGLPVAATAYSATTKKLLVQLADSVSREALEGIAPDTTAMLQSHDGSRVRGVIVTTVGHAKPGGYDFISRYFAPWNGIPEDPVTGSAHTVLAPHWAAILGRTELRARQCSKRGGDLLLEVGDVTVTVSGQAAVVLDGQLRLP
mmetsp:Transcript_13824/g.35533  ORF Transcript_13824/g.35533 Transcript_13824/m.35533 type:complete len:302 (-) Transcript_13824:474-1379(-)